MPDERTTQAQEWARLIQGGSTREGVRGFLVAIDREARERAANRADLIVACARILAHNITADPEDASEIRQGIMALIDGYAMEAATDAEWPLT